MKVLLVAINAKYIHTNIAVRYLQKYAAPHLEMTPEILEVTINNQPEWILGEIFRRQPDLLLFSTYIWNVSLVRRLAEEYRQISAETVIGAGGPEVSYGAEDFLRENPFFDLVIRGEGEEAFRQLAMTLESDGNWSSVLGLSFRKNGIIRSNPLQSPLDLTTLPFPYLPDCSDAPEQIKYYESSRGCPFQCQYCLSSIERGVREAPLSKVFADLSRFLAAGVRQVKFVDRTFNWKEERAFAIWNFLRENDNGITNFHFEITAELLTQKQLELLSSVRPGQFQLEIGVQSTNPETLKAIQRQNKWLKLAETVRSLLSFQNIHLHLDLIAGLPFEDYHSFSRSFNDVYALSPHQLQLGFLKLLNGAGLSRDREKYGLVCRKTPPYEILFTPQLPYRDVLRLKAVEEMVEQYYNSGRFVHTLRRILSLNQDPFSFYQQLGDLYLAQKRHYKSPSLEGAYEFLHSFILTLPAADCQSLTDTLKLDYCLHQRPKRHPEWFPGPEASALRRRCIRFLAQEENRIRFLPGYDETDPQYLYRLVRFEPFAHDPFTGEEKEVVLLFDYRRRDLLGNALAQEIILPEED